MAHLGTKFGYNTINTRKVIRDYLRKITPICCHEVNRTWQEAENWFRGRLCIEPQTFCSLKEIELKTIKIQRKNQQYVIITRSRITNKMPLLPDKLFSRINWKLACGWINQLWRALQWFRRIECQSSELYCENQPSAISVGSRYSNSTLILIEQSVNK